MNLDVEYSTLKPERLLHPLGPNRSRNNARHPEATVLRVPKVRLPRFLSRSTPQQAPLIRGDFCEPLNRKPEGAHIQKGPEYAPDSGKCLKSCWGCLVQFKVCIPEIRGVGLSGIAVPLSPKDHIGLRILLSGLKGQDKGDSRNLAL